MNLRKLHNDIHEGALQLIAEHRVHLLSKARNICNSEDEAEELVIRTIDQAIRKIDTFAGEGDILSWMTSILVNLHKHDYRSPVVQRTKAVDADELERCAGVDWSTDEQILKHSDSEAIRKALSGLDPKYHKVVLMRYYDEFSLKEIANVMQLPIGTVSRRLHFAHRILAGKLRNELGRAKKPLAVLAAVLTFTFAAAAVVTVPALAPVRDTVVGWFANGDNGGTGVPPVQSETVYEPKQEYSTPSNTTVTKKENAMNIKKIAAVSATLVGLSAAYPNQAMASSGESTKSFVWKGTGTTAEANRWSVGTNWEGDVAPTADDIGCVISIPVAAQDAEINNDIVNLQVGKLNIASPAAFTLVGEKLALTATGTFTSATPNFRCEMPLVLAEGATNSFSIATGLTNTFAPDVLRGRGGFKKTSSGEGTLVLEGDNTFDGGVVIDACCVKFSTAEALGKPGKTIRVTCYKNLDNPGTAPLYPTAALDLHYDFDFAYKSEKGIAIYQTKTTSIYGLVKSQSCSVGNVHFYGDVESSGVLQVRGGDAHFHGRILKPATCTVSTSLQLLAGSRKAYLYASGSTFDYLLLSSGSVECNTTNVLSDTTYFDANSNVGTFNMNGFDQVCGGFKTKASNYSVSDINAGQKACCLTVRTRADRMGRYRLGGPLTLVIDSPNGSMQTICWANTASTMTGDIIISNGIFKISSDASFSNVSGFEIGAGGRLIIDNAARTGTGDSDFRLTTGGRLELADGVVLTVNRLFKDGATVMSAYGKTFCALDAAEEGAEKVDWIEGVGMLVVNARIIADDARTWTGGAGLGGENEDMLDPRNWDPSDPAPTLVDGGLYPTFAAEGTNAWFAGNLGLNGLTFNATNDFAVTAKDANGTVSMAAAGIAATGAHAYAIDAALELMHDQTWTAAKGTTLRLARGMLAGSNYSLDLSGGGTFILNGDVSLSGDIGLAGSTLVLRDCNLSSTLGAFVAKDKSTTIRLENAVVSKPLTVAEIQNSKQLYSGAGTTNRVESMVTWNNECALTIEGGSQLTLAGGMSFVGTSAVSGSGKGASALVVTNGMLSIGSTHTPGTLTLSGLTAHIWSSDNMVNGGLVVNDGVQVFLHAHNSLTADTPIELFGPVDLCGRDQQCGCLRNSQTAGRFYSKTPAVMTVNQGKGSKASATTFVGHFEGESGLRKTSANALTLDSTNPTIGSLEVAGGELIMGPNATWGGADVLLTSGTSVLTLQGSKNLFRKTTLRVVNPSARINLAAGVRAKVDHLYVPSASDPAKLVKIGSGIYTSATCPFLTGDGSLEVRGGGLTILLY